MCCGLLLSACSYTDGEYPFDLQAEDLVGTWTSDEVSDVVLDLALDDTVSADADGIASALSWPRNAACSDEGAKYTSELVDAPTLDFAGRWTYWPGTEGNSLPDIEVDVPDDGCPSGGPHGCLWRDLDGRISICFPLGVQDPDTFSWDRMLVLRLQGAERSTDRKPCV